MFSSLNEAEFLATSTPVRQAEAGTLIGSLEDSGYFGSSVQLSGENSTSGKFLSFCNAPSAYFSFFTESKDEKKGERFPQKQRSESTRQTEISTVAHDRWPDISTIPCYYETLTESELNFKSSPDVSARVKLKKPFVKPTECCRMKRRKVDFLSELKKRNCPCIISSILHHLSADDLRRASCVQRGWREAIVEDWSANRRRRQSVLEARRNRCLALSEKENTLGHHVVSEREHKTAFFDITNGPLMKKQPLHKETDGRFNSFLQMAENLAPGQVLKKCPMCRFASRLQNESYVCSKCNYTFREKCGAPKTEIPSAGIGSKRSKRNLKRL